MLNLNLERYGRLALNGAEQSKLTIGSGVWERAIPTTSTKASAVQMKPTRVVRNLFDKKNRTRILGYFASSGTTWSYNASAYSNKIPCKPNTTYTARYNGNSTQAVLGFGSCSTDEEPNASTGNITVTQGVRQNNPTRTTPITITTGANDKWLIVAYNVAEPQNTDMADNLQIEEAATATPLYPHFAPSTVLPSLKAFGGTPVKHKQDKLWSRWIPVDYITFDGSSYLDLAPLTTASDIEVTFRRQNGYTQTNFLFGTNPDSSSSQCVCAWYGSSGFTVQNGAERRSTSIDTDWHTLKITSTKTYLDGTEWSDAGTRTQFQNLVICSARSPGSGAVETRCFRGDISRVKVGNKIFTACKDVTTNKFGLLDIATDTFYGNSGTGTITGGDLIQPLTYAESDRTAWADTGIIPTTFDYTITYEGAIKKLSAGPNCAWGYMGSSGNLPRWVCAGYSNNYLLNANTTAAIQGADTDNHTFVGKVYESGGVAKWSSEIDGVIKQNDQTLPDADTWVTNTLSIYLFARHNADGAGNYAPATLKRWICEKAGVVIRNYQPVRVGSTVELLDIVEWKFATRTGTFTAGSDIPYTQMCPDIITVNTGDMRYGVGKNLFDGKTNIVLGKYIAAATGVVSVSASNYYCEDYFEVKPTTSYVYWGERKSDGYISRYNRIHFYDASKTFISSSSYEAGQKSVVVSPANAKYARVSCNVIDTGTLTQDTIDLFNWYFGEGTATTEYEPYHFGLHTDGSHKLFVGSQGVVDLGTLSWIYQTDGTYPVFRATLGSPSAALGVPPIFTTAYSVYPTVTTATFIKTNLLDMTIAYQASSATNQLMVQDSRYTSAADFKAAMSGKYLFYQRTDDTSFVPPVSRDIPTLYSSDSFVDTQGASNNKSEAWKVLVLTGTENWSTASGGTGVFTYTLPDRPSSYPSLTSILCNAYTTVSGYTQVISTNGTFYFGSYGSGVGASYWHDDRFATVAEWKAWLAEQYAKGTPVLVLYPLATPAVSTHAIAPVELTAKATYTATSEAALTVTEQATYLGNPPFYNEQVGDTLDTIGAYSATQSGNILEVQ